MRYSFAIIAAFLGAAAASPAAAQSSTPIPVSEFTDGQPQAPTALPTSTTVVTVLSTSPVVTTSTVNAILTSTLTAVASTSTTTVTVSVLTPSQSTQNGALPASSTAAAPSVSVVSITTCIPTVILSTITLSSSSSTPVPTFTVLPTGTLASASTVVGALPTGSPIVPFQGNAARSFGGSFAMAGVAAVAAIILA